LDFDLLLSFPNREQNAQSLLAALDGWLPEDTAESLNFMLTGCSYSVIESRLLQRMKRNYIKFQTGLQLFIHFSRAKF